MAKKYQYKIIAKDVDIKFGENDITVDLFVNTEGNLSIRFQGDDEAKFAPKGTCIEGFNTDVIFYPFKG